jgi:hypothetical protein
MFPFSSLKQVILPGQTLKGQGRAILPNDRKEKN